MKSAEIPVIKPETFAKAAVVLMQLNDGASPDITPCTEVAAVLAQVRKPEVFAQLPLLTQEAIKTAAGALNHRCLKNEDVFINFLGEAFGATRKATTTEEPRRARISAFLENVAAAA